MAWLARLNARLVQSPWYIRQPYLALKAGVYVLFGLCVIAIAAGEVSEHRIGIGIMSIGIFLLAVLVGYFGDGERS